MPIRSTVSWVRFTQEGFHNWPGAPLETSYLRSPHRHLFFYEVGVHVLPEEHDRGVEFHDLLGFCRSQVKGRQLGANSCEMLATRLGEAVQDWLVSKGLGRRALTITVAEDNECGATVILD